jgi:hypothetical protein
MISEKQLEANRRNAQKSTGPKTPEGKSNSSRNNLRHGLTGQISLLPTEDREAHDAFCNELIDGFHPGTPVERQLAQSIAEDFWRLNRASAIENNIFALGHTNERNEIRIALSNARTFLAQANQFNLLTIYEQRINRNVQRNLKLLRELQSERKEERKAQREEPLEEAKLTAPCRQAEADPASPAPPASPFRLNENGFGFSNAEIDRDLDRDNRPEPASQPPLARAA